MTLGRGAAAGLLAAALTALGLPLHAEEPVDGAKLFRRRCAYCHGSDGRGSPTMARMLAVGPQAMNLRKESTRAKSDEVLAMAIEGGPGKMPAHTRVLSREDIRALIAFIRERFHENTTTGGSKP